MLAANLPVCQYPGMPGQNNSNNSSNIGGSNSNLNNSIGGNNNSVSSPNSNINNANCVSGGGLVGGGTSAAAAKNQLEQLNTMREALFSQDGWGCQHVNQDTNWEVPSSPEPTNKDPSAPPLWKPTVNNGTDLWESTLRNGGQPPSQTVQKTPWGHTPSTNLGGTWGEDDDGTDSSNVWTGSANNPNASASGAAGVGGNAPIVGGAATTTGQQWSQNNLGTPASSGTPVNNIPNVATGAPSAGGTVAPAGVGAGGGNGGASGNGWGDPRAIGGSIDIRGVDPMRAASAGDPRDLRLLDPRDPIRGDPRGISGRLNGSSEMWGQHHAIAHNQMPGLNKIVGQGGNSAVVANPAVPGLGPAVGGGMAQSVVAPAASQWGSGQPVVGPKDINAMASKQVSGWEEPSPPAQRRNIPNYDDGTSLWGQHSRVPGGGGGGGAQWKDIPDPMNRNHLLRNTIGNQNAAVVSGLGQVSSNASNGLVNPQSGGIPVVGNPALSNVGPQGRIPSSVGSAIGGQHKADTMWVHPNSSNVNGRNPGSSWGDDGNHNVGGNAGPNWIDEKGNAGLGQIGANVANANTWNEGWNKNQKVGSGVPGWVTGGSSSEGNELSSDWTAHGGAVNKPPPKIGGVGVAGINTEMIKQSKQFRFLVEAGFKKEDVERALINTNMNMEEAADMLRANPSLAIDGWRRHDETLSSYGDHTNAAAGGGGGFPGRYTTANSQPSMGFPPNNLVNNMSGSGPGNASNNPNLSSMNTIQPLQPVQKYMNQIPHSLAGGPQAVNPGVGFGQGNANLPAPSVNIGTNSNSQPSAQQLRMLVQQIQLAVHHGYLSNQILNQPLAPTTLVLLNQLLSNIKHLQGAQQSLTRGNNANNLQLNVAIAKHKQQIQTLQNQINAQQAHYIKQQQQSLQQTPQNHSATTHINNSSTDYLRGQHEAMNALQSNFSDISLNKTTGGFQVGANQQSRLTQWKLPVLEKEENTEFSRAPGTTKQNLTTNNSNNMGPLGLQSDGTWSTGRNIGDGWPDPSNENENKDWSVAPNASATSYTDLVQEFEPGKPWKGSQMKSIEDDPSITPGSVARSPLSINPTPKDADIFVNASKNSPTDLPTLGLSSSTWSFNPSSANQSFPSWSDNQPQCQNSEIWPSQMNKSSRGPPPGLGTSKTSNISTSVSTSNNAPSVGGANGNGWMIGNSRGLQNPSAGWAGGSNSTWNSNWLLLKNLTAQIDGSTLRTLCMQHGPPVSFHLYLNQGFALCKYATREEASKAQMTLNNCVLGNTTICAESPTESDVQSLLQHLPPQNQSQAAHASGVNTGSNGNGNGNSAIIAPNGTNLINNVVGNNALSGNGGGSGGNNINNGNGNNGQGGGQIASSSTSSITSSGVNTATTAANHNTWRQTSQQQQQQQTAQQGRPTGREADFDYISKYVCSIVDD